MKARAIGLDDVPAPVVRGQPDIAARLWVGRVALTNFRSYAAATVEVGPAPVVLLGANGAGKTNLLEAVSLLAPGTGLRRASYTEIARLGGAGDWAVAARVTTREGTFDIGTGQHPDPSLAASRPLSRDHPKGCRR